MATLEDLAFDAEQDLGRTKAFFPILPRLGNGWALSRPWSGRTIGLNLHLTTLTAALVQELTLGGARCVVSAANPGTTDAATVALLRSWNVAVHTGGDREDRHQQVLDTSPDLLVDAGFDLVEAALAAPEPTVRAAVLTSRSGVVRARAARPLPIPVVDLTAGRLHDAVENRHGIGEAVWLAVSALTGIHLAGRRAAVVGYGPVGRGLATWARHAGMAVEVVEADPVRRLFAHYDGFATPGLPEALARAQIVATATGRPGVIGVAALREARSGLVLLNAGTGGDEIDVPALRRAAEVVDHMGQDVVRYGLEGGTTVTVLGDGHPLNIVLNSGSPEPVLLQHAVVGLSLEWLAQQALTPGLQRVPDDLEVRAAELALDALASSDPA
ncbi:MAG: hypothetical protein H6732_05265 [Alphaproteobacteria bacterium]|nr:hypothetical protein [Alphaproteobacteria bacterium]